MKIALELIGVPVDPEELARKCPVTPKRFGEAIAKKAVEQAGGIPTVQQQSQQQQTQEGTKVPNPITP